MTAPSTDRLRSFHPRRTTPGHSVSLLHSRPRVPSPLQKHRTSTDEEEPTKTRASPDSGPTASPSSLQALGKDSSGETSNADRWFENCNSQVRGSSAAFVDNDPPFLMRNSSSLETPPDVWQPERNFPLEHGPGSLPLHASLLQLGTAGSGTEEFRSVIDDLTIENRKLKRRLKKYEKIHDSYLKDDKLFEVRIHGLPADRKRELEETLRKFTSGLESNRESAFPRGYASQMPMLRGGKVASSHRSLQNTDSAYASMPASGQESLPQAGTDQNLTPSQHLAARRQNIHDYLHDIPEDLLHQQNPSKHD